MGSVLKATTGVNMRSGPSTGYKVLLVVPAGGKVTTVEKTSPENGFYKVKYNGTVGYSHGQYYTLVSSPTTPPPASTARDAAINRAKSAMGFSYWWGHARFLPQGSSSSTAGSCSGDCPSCSHSGSYGGDCSGLAAKVWQVGSSNTDLTVDKHPYSTYNFDNERTYWHSVSRGSMQKADAMVYNTNGSGHIFIFESGDGWGSMWAYECKGCAYGCVHNLRTATNDYIGIGKNGY
ncbi:MAG: SH3 domain-containing protein [Myxococcales bacterium]